MMEYLLDRVAPLSFIQEVFIVSNERFYPNFVEWARKKRFSWKMEIVSDGTSTNETRLGALGDLNLINKRLEGKEDIALFAGDNLFSCDLQPFFDFGLVHRPHATIGVADIHNRERAKQYGVVGMDKENRVTQFLEKPENPPSTLVSTGVYCFPRESLNLLDRYFAEGHNADRLGDFAGWLVKTDRLFAYPIEGKWLDIGDKDSYQEADRLFQKKH